MRFRQLLFFTLLVAFFATGCIFSPDNDEEPPTKPPVTCSKARTPDQALNIFKEVYSDWNLDCYRELLSPDYIFVNLDGNYTNYDNEIAISEKMFNGLAGRDGVIISDISVVQLDPTDTWEDTVPSDPDFGGFPDSKYQAYDIEIRFTISGQNLVYLVKGPVVYYVTNEGSDSDPDYKLLGMRDQTAVP